MDECIKEIMRLHDHLHEINICGLCKHFDTLRYCCDTTSECFCCIMNADVVAFEPKES